MNDFIINLAEENTISIRTDMEVDRLLPLNYSTIEERAKACLRGNTLVTPHPIPSSTPEPALSERRGMRPLTTETIA